MSGSSLRALPPATRRRLILGGGTLAALIVVHCLVLRPVREECGRKRAALAGIATRNNAALRAIREMPQVEAEIARLRDELAAATNRFVLRPVLGSYPVQSDIYRLAAESGFKVARLRELGAEPTPRAPTPQKTRRPASRQPAEDAGPPDAFARYRVEAGGEGSLAETTGLLRRLEEENPYCGVVALNIRAIPSAPERHRVALTLEWPVAADAEPPPAGAR
jgi:hypothetical protein